ncbi:hypothetical protein K8I61_20820, partial [bacterium]|nr:hypothetical protein [bacterium]
AARRARAASRRRSDDPHRARTRLGRRAAACACARARDARGRLFRDGRRAACRRSRAGIVPRRPAAQLRFGWYLETLDAAFLAAGDDAFDGRFSLSSRVVESTRRLDPFSDAVAESIARVAADAALSGASLLVISGLTLAPEQGFSASAREAFASPANASADPASMFGATIVEDGAATPERLEPYAAYAEHKAARLAEIVRRAVEAAKKANAGVRVFVEVPAMAVLDPADGLARFGVDAEAMLAAGADGLFIRATWRPASPEAVPDGEKTEWLSGLAARALELAPDPKDIVIAIPVADARTRKPYPDWEVRRAIDAALGGVPCGVALFPLVSDIPYNRVFAPIAKTRQPESP